LRLSLSRYEQLLGFDGDEFYTSHHPELHGKPFSSCVEHFKMAVAIGVVENKSTVVLNPSNDYAITKDTDIVVVAEDDDSYECGPVPFKVPPPPPYPSQSCH